MSAKSFSLRNLRHSQTDDSVSADSPINLTLGSSDLELPNTKFSGHFNQSTSTLPSSSFSKTNGLIELTKNSKYGVLRLPAVPALLKHPLPNQQFFGSIDKTTRYALVASPKDVYVWKYASSEESPQAIFFESSNVASNTIPFSLLISPIAGIKEPGLITIIPDSGVVTYWESVEGALANEMLQKKKSIVYQIKLYGSEHIEYIENIEPAGIVAATNVGRFILITYRDGTGKPVLQSETMKTSGYGFFATLKEAVTLSDSRRGVVSIKPGKSTGRDERHAVAMTKEGNLMIWDCFRTGQSHLLLEENLRDVMLDSIPASHPTANTTFAVHDVEYHNILDYIYVLGSVDNIQAAKEVAYFLFTFAIKQNVLTLVATHQFKTVTSFSSCRPRLLLPKPYTTLFASFSNAVILTDATPESPNESNHTFRWEDSIKLLPGVEAFAFGAEDLVENNKKSIGYPGVVAITKQAGLLRIERYADSDEPNIESAESLSFQIAKTKIEQAVFFGYKNETNNPIDFGIDNELRLDSDVLEKAFSQISAEIVGSTSPYLPSTLSSLGEHLDMRWNILSNMADFFHQNEFNEFELNSKLSLLCDLEKLCAAKSLWQEYSAKLDEQTSKDTSIDNVISEIIVAVDPNAKGDKVRFWFTRNIENFSKLLLQASLYSAKNEKNYRALQEVNHILLTAVPFSAYRIRNTFGPKYFGISEGTCGSAELWTRSSQVLAAFSHQYQQTVKTLHFITKTENDEHYLKLSQQLVTLVSTLCQIHCDRIAWLEENNDFGKAKHLKQAYEKSRTEWVNNLVKFGHQQEALQIAEKYSIYQSLAEIIGQDYRAEIDNAGHDTTVSFGLISKLHEYIRTYGYEFATVLFQYYVDTQQLKSLIKQFSQFNEYLERFFASGDYDRFSWIHDLLVNKNEKAAFTLFTVATEKESATNNKLLQLSIAKLSALTSGNKPNTPTTQVAALQKQIDSQLEFLNVQKAVSSQLAFNLDKNKNNVSLHIDRISNFLNKNNLNQLQAVLRRTILRLAHKQTLTINELVDILTLSDIDTNAESIIPAPFFLAFKLIHLFTANGSTEKTELNEQIIWRRLYVRDDWAELDKAESKGDDNAVKADFSKTVLYKTFVYIIKQKLDQELDMEYVANPERSIWKEAGSNEKCIKFDESELLERYPSVLDTLESAKKQKKPKNKSILDDIRSEGLLLQTQIDKHNLKKWAQVIYNQAETDVASNKSGCHNGSKNMDKAPALGTENGQDVEMLDHEAGNSEDIKMK